MLNELKMYLKPFLHSSLQEYIELNVPYEESNKRLSQDIPSPHEDTPLLQSSLQNSIQSTSSPKMRPQTPPISNNESDPLAHSPDDRSASPGVDAITTIIEQVNELEENGSVTNEDAIADTDVRIDMNGENR